MAVCSSAPQILKTFQFSPLIKRKKHFFFTEKGLVSNEDFKTALSKCFVLFSNLECIRSTSLITSSLLWTSQIQRRAFLSSIGLTRQETTDILKVRKVYFKILYVYHQKIEHSHYCKTNHRIFNLSLLPNLLSEVQGNGPGSQPAEGELVCL